MPTKLKAKAPEASRQSRPKVLVFGPPGVGKTWVTLDFPSVYFIDPEGGAKEPQYIAKLTSANGAYFGPEDGALDFKTVNEQLEGLATEKHRFKTVVIDSFSKLFNTAVALEAERLEQHGIKNEFGKDRKPATAMTRRLIMWADRMDMNLILVCHQKADYASDSNGNRVQIGETFDGYDKLEYELGLCLQIVRQGTSRIAKIRKSRLETFREGDKFPWSYKEFAERFGRGTIEAEVTPVALASEEQIADLKRLIESVKTPEGELDKWLSKANASTVEELGAEHAAKLIEFLKKKVS